jgi:hypothetical protein
MNLLTFYCGVLMLLITSILLIGRIRTGKAIDGEGHFVSAMDNPIYFFILTVFNFIFLLAISTVMIFLSMIGV